MKMVISTITVACSISDTQSYQRLSTLCITETGDYLSPIQAGIYRFTGQLFSGFNIEDVLMST